MDYNELLYSIMHDDLVTFEKLTRPNQTYNVCFGRFPALSLCYMYEAVTILKRHEGDMLKFSDGDYVFAEETIRIYEDFKVIAEKCLRFYVGGKKVEPIEMLALLGKSSHLTTVWQFAPKTQAQLALIEKIYALKFDAECTATQERIAVPNIKIKDEKKRAAGIWAIGSLGFTVVLSALLVVFIFVIGLGVESNPLRIYSGDALVKQAENAKYVTLYRDVSIVGTIDSTEAIIDGNGHTLSLSAPLFKTFKGELRNVKIEYTLSESVTSDSAVILDNQGVVEGVTINAKLDFKEETEEKNVYVCALVVENSGEINRCNITVSSKSSSNGEGNVYLSGLCGKNSGKITYSSVSGNMESDTVDVAGVCVQNSGEITDCINNANVKQTSDFLIVEEGEEGPDYSLWNPNCAGLVLTNEEEGTVHNCINNGNVTVVSTVELPLDENGTPLTRAEAFSGGIAAINVGVVERSRNFGEIAISSKDAYSYVGGIVACNTTKQVNVMASVMGSVKTCYSKGKLTIDTSALTLAGGIVGYNAGAITYCYTDCDVQAEENVNQAIGGIIGMDSCDMAFSQIVYNSNVAYNYSVAKEQAPYAIGALSYRTFMGGTQNVLVSENMLFIDENEDTYVGQYNYAVENIDYIKNLEGYWE